MNFFSRLFSAAASKLKAIPQRVSAWREGVRKKRSNRPVPPKGYVRPKPVKTTEPFTTLPDLTDVPYQTGENEATYIEYRDMITERLTFFDFPVELIDRIGDLGPDDLMGIDFTRLNAAMERLEKYRTAYENGTVSFDDFDHDYYIHEINQSIPGFDWYPEETWKLEFFGAPDYYSRNMRVYWEGEEELYGY